MAKCLFPAIHCPFRAINHPGPPPPPAMKCFRYPWSFRVLIGPSWYLH